MVNSAENCKAVTRKVNMKRYALVGSGIKSISHLTQESTIFMADCEKLFILVNEPILKEYLLKQYQHAEPLDDLYFSTDRRADNYAAIEAKLIQSLDEYNSVTFLCYGHPTVFAESGLKVAKQLEGRGDVKVNILPGISALDCLFADLKVDPGHCGMVTYEVHDLLVYSKAIEPNSQTVIWQVGMIGNLGKPSYDVNRDALIVLKEYLLKYFDENHECVVYEAAMYSGMNHKEVRFKLSELESQEYSPISTLYIPPVSKARPDNSVRARLGINLRLDGSFRLDLD